jgi:hypothetical protein
MKLEDLNVVPHFRGFHVRELFENGYGISVIPENDASEEPLYEVAVLRHNEGKHATMAYDTGITEDVIRFCTVDVVDTLIERIRSLPKAE